ncbi:MAG: hypothetical protein AWU54_2054 [Candidatus Frackibacter sp. T328-2]|nr:MAG: hypothetical protein AWU54_2054 [Candidatus Frackibacter sp. T328-2]
MKRKAIILLSLVVIMLISGVVQAKAPVSMEQIKKDLVGKEIKEYTEQINYYETKTYKLKITKNNIKDMKMIKSQTRDMQYKVFINMTLINSRNEGLVNVDLKLLYNKYDQGWILDEISKDSKIDYIPTKTISKDRAKNYIQGEPFFVVEYPIRASEENIKSLKIIKRKTDLDKKLDSFLISLALDNGHVSGVGLIKLVYRFDKGEWSIYDRGVVQEFK